MICDGRLAYNFLSSLGDVVEGWDCDLVGEVILEVHEELFDLNGNLAADDDEGKRRDRDYRQEWRRSYGRRLTNVLRSI